MSDIVEVRNLTYEYPTVRALDAISFTIRRGSITALVGPNGAGKSTLLRCIAGLDFPLEGEIFVNNTPVFDDPRRIHRFIGYLPDNFGLYDTLTVSQSLHYAARSQWLDENTTAQSVQETAERLNLEDRLPQKVGELSRGLRQRVAIAQAVIHQPEFLLLDEPASGLDPGARHDLSELFCRFKQDGMTLLVSSHILAELKEYSTDILIMNAGKVIRHSAVKSNETEASLTLEIQLASEQPEISQLLSAVPGISAIEVRNAVVRFRLDESQTPRMTVIQQLIDQGIPVKHFVEVNDMQQTYLDAVREADQQNQKGK